MDYGSRRRGGGVRMKVILDENGMADEVCLAVVLAAVRKTFSLAPTPWCSEDSARTSTCTVH